MYLFGHAASLERHRSSRMWPRVLDMLRADQSIGPALPLKCANHPDTLSLVAAPHEFDVRVHDGGCQLKCETRMGCGHVCPLLCHPNDSGHVAVFCPKPCVRLRPAEECPEQHACRKQCGHACGPCPEWLHNMPLDCGHQVKRVACNMYYRKLYKCLVKVEVTPPCGHVNGVHCYEAAAVAADRSLCRQPCGAGLPCGHSCSKRCEQEHEHICSVACQRSLSCGHECRGVCHGDQPCPPCRELCPLSCGHSRCERPCHEDCSPCMEACVVAQQCPHQAPCALPCGAPCTRLPCSQPCGRKMPCGHPCVSPCGEPCPPQQACRQCCPPAQRSRRVDLIGLATLAEHDPAESPLMKLPCGHIFTVESLDGVLELSKYYQIDPASGNPVGLLPFGGVNVPFPLCPDCRKPISGTARYARLYNQAQLCFANQRFLIDSENQQQRLEQTLLAPLRAALAGAAVGPDAARLAKRAVADLQDYAASRQRAPPAAMYAAMQASLQHAGRREALELPANSSMAAYLRAAKMAAEAHDLALSVWAMSNSSVISEPTRLYGAAGNALAKAMAQARSAKFWKQLEELAVSHMCLRATYVKCLFKARRLSPSEAFKTQQTQILDDIEASMAELKSPAPEVISS